jgi:formylglycine-generating enzyme required for sulfatase activity
VAIDSEVKMKIQAVLLLAMVVTAMVGDTNVKAQIPDLALITGGEFEMGDHSGLGGEDPKHPSDEVPVHAVYIDSFYMGITEATNQQYCDYLNSALSQGLIEVRGGIVYAVGGSDIYCETRESVPYSRIGWDGGSFTILDNKGSHPMVGI